MEGEGRGAGQLPAGAGSGWAAPPASSLSPPRASLQQSIKAPLPRGWQAPCSLSALLWPP